VSLAPDGQAFLSLAVPEELESRTLRLHYAGRRRAHPLLGLGPRRFVWSPCGRYVVVGPPWVRRLGALRENVLDRLGRLDPAFDGPGSEAHVLSFAWGQDPKHPRIYARILSGSALVHFDPLAKRAKVVEVLRDVGHFKPLPLQEKGTQEILVVTHAGLELVGERRHLLLRRKLRDATFVAACDPTRMEVTLALEHAEVTRGSKPEVKKERELYVLRRDPGKPTLERLGDPPPLAMAYSRDGSRLGMLQPTSLRFLARSANTTPKDVSVPLHSKGKRLSAFAWGPDRESYALATGGEVWVVLRGGEPQRFYHLEGGRVVDLQWAGRILAWSASK
jgi:hypothetical protein